MAIVAMATVMAMALVMGCADATAVFNVMDYGAVANNNTVAAAFANGRALNAALIAANTSGEAAPRIVLIPDAGDSFVMMPDAAQPYLTGLTDVTVQIDGELLAYDQGSDLSNATAVWPVDPSSKQFLNFIEWRDVERFRLTGAGRVDGQCGHTHRHRRHTHSLRSVLTEKRASVFFLSPGCVVRVCCLQGLQLVVGLSV
jgi:hypothetical protein